ncbi:DNA-3-methyladenine glycosylase [Acidisarcina polymorpha]|uniref:DNA-3-methyladenine glycosylase n=1 Tax=Acidisarcina polymorpha TaxID=2211140 RepID=UPI001F0224F3|nr:DNA-3-methyladenine glycosylase [Acidisarcina polymorpha]
MEKSISRANSDLGTLLPEFYLDPPDVVARRLVGKLLLRRLQAEFLIGRIVETEAYLGQDDPAAHAFAGQTSRNQVIFGPPGRAYVYFIYGVHYCLNVSCEPEGKAGCVLIRALKPIAGLATMAALRKLPADAQPRLLTSGPGKLCQALAIRRETHNGMDLTNPDSDLQIRSDGYKPGHIAVTPRIGISKASHLPLRFHVEGNRFVSGASSRIDGGRR